MEIMGLTEISGPGMGAARAGDRSPIHHKKKQTHRV